MIMSEALDDHDGIISIDRRITTFLFTDYFIVNAEKGMEIGFLVDHLDISTKRYKKETKVMTNNQYGFQRGIKIKGQKLEEMKNFKYLGSIIVMKIQTSYSFRIAQTTGTLSLNVIVRERNFTLASNVALIRTFIVSTFH